MKYLPTNYNTLHNPLIYPTPNSPDFPSLQTIQITQTTAPPPSRVHNELSPLPAQHPGEPHFPRFHPLPHCLGSNNNLTPASPPPERLIELSPFFPVIP
ncbi:hypothetical protein BDN72DRAFT_54686 [Pluteus cervinus]|uniref:Uncharacterized protein n=1 Tax=Pluteus cervinus TaxID=181527 RepID=A0ACD3B941_9AGAR|nr:hypothetical protein BDN72DRAFT_54686 [Pluteus cervinus]